MIIRPVKTPGFSLELGSLLKNNPKSKPDRKNQDLYVKSKKKFNSKSSVLHPIQAPPQDFYRFYCEGNWATMPEID